MASEGLIARSPAKDSQFAGIRAGDKDCLSVSVAFGWPNEKVYAMFHPEFVEGNGRLNKEGKRQCAQFFAYAKHREYMDAYRETLAKSGGGRADSGEELAIDDSRKDKALKSLLNKAMSLVEGGTDLDAESLKVISDIFRKLNLLKDETEQEIRPLRFLPELCFSGCRYRLFVENAIKGGDVIDECKFCRALRYATENGYRDNATNRLDIPKEVLDTESDNTISTLDILSGKVEN
ncbi:MAG: hypothetical protein K2K45_05080 [Muribaculaceae bacterium]|nr:hypothetical protein [Muribaculaceae bacterium]